jgi:hypothetical protein
MLIVDDDPRVLRARSSDLEADGWSVAAYTFSKLEALGKKGALFLQHLKLESRILCDNEGRLRAILDSFQPKSDYRQEIAENTQLARLAACVPTGDRGALLAADILYVAVRNFGVLQLAERGIHIYSFNFILEALESERIISVRAKQSLAALRFLKCIYRSGEGTQGTHTLDVLNQAVSKLPEAYFPVGVEPQHPLAIIHRPVPDGLSSSYLLLRDLELRFVALQAMKPDLVVRNNLRQLSRWIENPRAYASVAALVAPQLRLAIERSCTRLAALARIQERHAAV